MKKRLIALTGFFALLIVATGFNSYYKTVQSGLTGAWHLRQGSIEQVLIFQDGYFSHTVFDKTTKKFIGTYGGIYKTDGKALKLLIEFDSKSNEDIGKGKNISHSVADKMLHIDITGSHQYWTPTWS